MEAPVAAGYAWRPTGVNCACGDCENSEVFGSPGIPYDVGVVQGKGVIPCLNEHTGEVEYLDWLDDDGIPFLNVVYLCDPTNTELERFMAQHHDQHQTECFTSLMENVYDAIGEAEVMYSTKELITCDACSSSIVNIEPCILFTQGVLAWPSRCPPHTNPVKFEPDLRHHERAICLDCAKLANMLQEPPIWTGRLYEERTSWRDET